LKTFAIIIVGLLVVVVAIVLIAPSFINWNAYKAEIEAQVEKATGRKLTINGDISAAVLPAPVLRVADVSLANAPSGRAETMVKLASLEVRIALGPLLGGQVQVKTVQLVDPVIHLEKGSTGGNWQLASPESTTSEASAETSTEAGGSGDASTGAASGLTGIRLDDFTITNGTVIYYDAVAGTEERVTNLNANIRAASLQGPFEVDGTFVARGLPLSVDATVGQIVHERTVSVRMDAGIGDDAAVTVTGTVTGMTEEPKFKGQIVASSRDLADLIARLSGGARQAALAKSFTADAQISASPSAVQITDMRIGLGDESLTGGIEATLGDATQFALTLAAGRIDADAIMALQPQPKESSSASSDGSSSKSAAATAAIAQAAPNSSPASIPATLQGTVSLAVDAIIYQGEKVGPVRLNAEIANGEVTLSQLTASAPGGIDVAMFGFLTMPQGQPSFDGEVEAKVSDVRAAMEWLDVPPPAVPSDRLRTFAYKSRVIATPAQIQLAGMVMAVDASQMTGGVTIALRDRTAFGADISIDKLNLDAYLPSQTAAQATQPSTTAADGTATAQPTNTPAAPQSLFSPLRVLTTFDANLKARIGLLTYNRVPIKNAALDVTLFQGDLTIRQASIAQAAGASVAITGNVSDLAGLPKAKGLRINFAAADLGPVMALVGQSTPPLAANLGAVKMDATLDGALSAPAFNAALSGGGATINAQGKAAILDLAPGLDAVVRVQHSNMNRLLQVLGVAYRPSGALGAVDVSTKVNAGLTQTVLTDLKGRIGGTTLNGTATARYGGPKPVVDAAFKTGVFVVDPFLPAKQAAGVWPSTPGLDQTEPVRRKVLSVAPRWPTDAIDLSALGLADGQIALNAEALVYGPYEFENADVLAKLQSGILRAEKVTGRLFGGAFSTTATVDSNTGAIDATISLSGAGIANALQAITGKAIAAGGINFQTTLTTRGNSVADYISALNGNGSIGLSQVDPKGSAGGGTALAGALGLVSGLANLNSALSLQGGPTSSLADMNATFTIENGVAKTSDVGILSSLGQGKAAGVVDLAGWGINLDGEISLAQSVLTQLLTKSNQTQTVPFSISGALDSPNVKMDTASLASGGIRIIPGVEKLLEKKGVGTILQGILGGGVTSGSDTQQQPTTTQPSSGSAPPSQQPPSQQPSQQQQPLKPEDLLKQLLKIN